MGKFCRVVLWAACIFTGERAAEVRWPEVSETTLWSLSAASFLALLFIEMWDKWTVLWGCFQKVMPVPLRSDTPKNDVSGVKTEDLDQQSATTHPLFNIADYSEYHNYLLYDGACLWVGVRPHHPVTHLKAEIKLGQLKSAIRGGQLQCQWRYTLGEALAFFAGQTIDRNPSDKQVVGRVALRRYADLIGDVPEFLRHVQAPVELPPAEENGGDEAKDITPPATETGAGDKLS